MSTSRRPELEAYLGIKLSPEMMAKIHQAVEDYLSENLEDIVKKCVDDCIEEVLKKCLEEREKLTEKEVLELRKIPRKEAVALIKEYIDEHQGCRTSDIIYDLALDPELALSVLKELEEKKEIRGE